MAGNSRAGVLGVEHRIDDELADVVVLQACRRGLPVACGTRRAMRSFARYRQRSGTA